MQNIQLNGRLTAKPELKEVNGSTVANFTIASESHYKDASRKNRVDFINCELWNGRAKAFAENHEKGSRVSVTGQIKTNTVAKDGKNKTYFSFAVDSFEFVESKAQTQARAAKA